MASLQRWSIMTLLNQVGVALLPHAVPQGGVCCWARL